MNEVDELLANNRAWAQRKKAEQPDFFENLAKEQTPGYLWIGCSDSRVPASEILSVGPGSLFVHRNVANVVVHTDLNCLSAIQFAVEALKVKHVIVCGHYGCGGVQAAYHNFKYGLIDNWLRHVQDVRDKHSALLSTVSEDNERVDRLCELNVIEQALNVCQTTIVQGAWDRKQELAVHGWIYNLASGLLRDLTITVGNQDELLRVYQRTIAGFGSKGMTGGG